MVAREDHQHRLEVIIQKNETNIGFRPSINFTGGAVVTDDVGNDRVNVDIPNFTANIPTQIDVGDVGMVGISTEISRSDHQRAFPVPGNPITVSGGINNPGLSTNVAREDHQHRLEVSVEDNGLLIGSRPSLNFINSTSITDDGGNDRVNIILSNTPLSNNDPSTLNIGDISASGISIEASRSDHVHEFPIPDPPVNVNKSAANAGISTNAARADHKHDIDTSTPVTAVGSINNEGGASTLSRSDHLHRIELGVQNSGLVIGSRPNINIIGANSIIDDAGNDRVDINIPALTINIPTQIDVGDVGMVGISTDVARSDHQHSLPAPGNPETVIGSINNPGLSTNVARQDHQHRLELSVEDTGILIGSRPTLNFSGVTVADDAGNDRVNVIVPAIFTLATPLIVSASGTVALGGAEIVLLSGNITIPPGSTGRIYVSFGCNVTLGSFLLGTNGARIRLRIGGIIVTSSTRSIQYSVGLGVSISLDGQEMSTSTLRTGLLPGVVLIEILAIKLGGVSSASITGDRELNAFSV